MDNLQKLAEAFSYFPGIGNRQSKRFVYFLLKQNQTYIKELVSLIEEVKRNVRECAACHRYFAKHNDGELCKVCLDDKRENSTLLIVEKDSDLESFERSHVYRGQYFVMGGTLQILEKDPEMTLRGKFLISRIKQLVPLGLSEIIIATSLTPESEHTGEYIRDFISDVAATASINITMLGRGLSTGSELEYADADTLRYALEGRK